MLRLLRPARLGLGCFVLVATPFVFAPSASSAQTPEQAVRAVVDQMFDGMRSGDSTSVRAAFDADARLVTVSTRGPYPVLQLTPLDQFVLAVGTPHGDVWDEQIWEVDVRVDGDLADVWASYAFYLGDQFSHCGVDAFQLYQSPDGWKIFHLADTRRTDDCEVPPRH